ncbi:MAG TPA: Hint domain-containing protein, partial [Roseococcus sp.]|nr:Hint domain-containing protein [Roseococcus sp.]
MAPDTLPPLDASPFTVCFLAGTRIATPDGERLVEDLAIGDLVLTADGWAVPVTWMGRQRVFNHRFGLHEGRAPVCIGAGALGEGLPHTDLFVSANHGMIWEGLVVNAGAMVNGTTIRFVPRDALPAEFTYFHIETEGHEVVLANGAPAETFVDYVTRRHFDNYQEYLDLY